VRHAWLVLGALQLCACNAILGIGDFTVAGDGGPPPPPDGGDLCLGTLVNVCFDLPQPDLTGLGDRIDTDVDCTLVAPQPDGGGDVCVILSQTLDLSGPLRAFGTRPLMLIAADSIRLSGAILDLSSIHNPLAQPGAGADQNLCEALPTGAEDPNSGSGGGGGGALGSKGGDGGAGGGGQVPGGIAGAPFEIFTLRGGCRGGDGGKGLAGNGASGTGGGAIYLVAGNSITIDNASAVFASGAGGGEGFQRGGGGGGGSGGLVALEAGMLAIDGILAANGGGGGGGAGDADAKPGSDGTTFQFMLRAQGGTGDGMSGGGGDGGGLVEPAGNSGGTAQLGGGGGGGGSAGAIWLKGTMMMSSLRASPSPLFN